MTNNNNSNHTLSEIHTTFAPSTHSHHSVSFPILQCCFLPLHHPNDDLTFHCRWSCYKAAKEKLQDSYNIASQYLNPDSTQGLNHIASDFYYKKILKCFQPILNDLKHTYMKNDQLILYAELQSLINDSDHFLSETFCHLLRRQKEISPMLSFDHYLYGIRIKENFLPATGNLWTQIRNFILNQNVIYHYDSDFALDELKTSLEAKCRLFYTMAYHDYLVYTQQIEELTKKITA